MSHATGNSSNTVTAPAAAAPRTRNRRTFHGRGLELNNHFKEWWKEARKSEEPPKPYEFLSNFGLNVNNDRRDVVPKMMWSTIGSMIPEGTVFTPGPGALDYYLYYLKDGLEKLPDGCDEVECFPEYPIEKALCHGAGEHGVTEQDIKSLIQFISPSDEDIQICIKNNYSPDLVECFFEHCYEPTMDLQLNFNGSRRQVVDETLISTIQKHIGRITNLGFSGEWSWTKDAFAQYLSMMLHRESPDEWDLWIPDAFVDSPNDYALIKLPHQESGSSIKKLTISLSRCNEAYNQQVMEMLNCMIGLEHLSLHVRAGPSLTNTIPYLIRYLHTTTVLTDLFINSRDSSEAPTTNDILVLPEALKTNSSILGYTHIGVDRLEFYESIMLGILKEHNTTLREITLVNGRGRPQPRVTTEKKNKVRNQIHYYLMLNKCGRGRARDPELGLLDLLSILGKANQSLLEFMKKRYPWYHQMNQEDKQEQERLSKKTLNILFGLLRQQPVMWSAAHSVADIAEESRKRKHQNQQEGSQRKQQKES